MVCRSNTLTVLSPKRQELTHGCNPTGVPQRTDCDGHTQIPFLVDTGILRDTLAVLSARRAERGPVWNAIRVRSPSFADSAHPCGPRPAKPNANLDA
jgi:hypothetical protein